MDCVIKYSGSVRNCLSVLRSKITISNMIKKKINKFSVDISSDYVLVYDIFIIKVCFFATLSACISYQTGCAGEILHNNRDVNCLSIKTLTLPITFEWMAIGLYISHVYAL